MFGKTPQKQILMPEPSTHLKSYSGHRIECLGSRTLQIQCKSQTHYKKQKFYIIDIPGLAIVGLPTCQLLELMQLHVDSLVKPAGAQPNATTPTRKGQQLTHHVPPPDIKIHRFADLHRCFSDCSDSIGSSKGKEHLHLREDAEAFIDPPRSYIPNPSQG